MPSLGHRGRPGDIKRIRPHALGSRSKAPGFNIFGSFKRAAGTILGGLKKVVVAAGNIAQQILDIMNAFPFLKPIANFPIPIPGFGAIKVRTLLKGVATVGRVTERLANAMEVYARGGSFGEIVKELPISDVVLFVLSPIIESFGGAMAIARVGESGRLKMIRQLAEKLMGMFKKIPKPVRLGIIRGIEDKLKVTFPQDIKDALVKA